MFDDTGVLTPPARKALYSLASVLAVALTFISVSPDFNLDGWVEVVVQAVGALGLVLAAIKTKRVDYTVFYGAGAALVAALTVVGVIKTGTDAQLYDLLAQVSLAIPALTAVFRTNTTVPTGEPQAEYVAEHAAVSLDAVVEPNIGGHGGDPYGLGDERGAFDTGPLIAVAAVIVIIAGIIFIAQAL